MSEIFIPTFDMYGRPGPHVPLPSLAQAVGGLQPWTFAILKRGDSIYLKYGPTGETLGVYSTIDEALRAAVDLLPSVGWLHAEYGDIIWVDRIGKIVISEGLYPSRGTVDVPPSSLIEIEGAGVHMEGWDLNSITPVRIQHTADAPFIRCLKGAYSQGHTRILIRGLGFEAKNCPNSALIDLTGAANAKIVDVSVVGDGSTSPKYAVYTDPSTYTGAVHVESSQFMSVRTALYIAKDRATIDKVRFNACITAIDLSSGTRAMGSGMIGEMHVSGAGTVIKDAGGASVYIGKLTLEYTSVPSTPLIDNSRIYVINVLTFDPYNMPITSIFSRPHRAVILHATTSYTRANNTVIGRCYNLSQSVGIGTNNNYASAREFRHPLGAFLDINRIRIDIGGTVASGETITVKIETLDDTDTVRYIEKSFTSTGSTELTGGDLAAILPHQRFIGLVRAYAKTNQSSTSATVTVRVQGL